MCVGERLAFSSEQPAQFVLGDPDSTAMPFRGKEKATDYRKIGGSSWQ